MLKLKISSLVVSLFLALLFSSPTFATPPAENLTAVFATQEQVRVGAEITFDAAHSQNPFPEQPISYKWDFGDGTQATGISVQHSFPQTGTFEVTLQVKVGNNTAEHREPIFVFKHAVLVFGGNFSSEKIEALVAAAREQKIFLKIINQKNSFTELLSSNNLFLANLHANAAAIQTAEKIILLENESKGLLELVKFSREVKPPLNFQNKKIILISEGDLAALAKLSRGIFNQINPQEILLTRPDALRKVISAAPQENLAEILTTQVIAFQQINSSLTEFNFWAPLTFLVNYLLSENIPPDVILLVLLLPFIAMIIAFFKQVVGLTTFGVFTPAMLTLSFLIIGLKLGIIVLIVVVLASISVRHVLKHYRLTYTSRLAIVLSIVALAIFMAIVFIAWLAPDYFSVDDLIAASIFPMLVMSTLAEKFVLIQTEKGAVSAFRLFLEALLVSVVCYLVVGKWDLLRMLILTTPEIIGLVLLANVGLGRFTGLRLTEYVRFREVRKKAEEE